MFFSSIISLSKFLIVTFSSYIIAKLLSPLLDLDIDPGLINSLLFKKNQVNLKLFLTF